MTPEPSGYELELLATVDVTTLTTDQLHDHLNRVDMHVSLAEGVRQRAIAALVAAEPNSAPEILASAIDETTSTADRMCEAAHRLHAVHPAAQGLHQEPGSGVLVARLPRPGPARR